MTALPAIARPNGKFYRPRRLRAVGWHPEDWGQDGPPQTAVLGTHDVETALRYAAHGFTCAHLINPTVGWLRQSIRDGNLWWVPDEARGAACVIFDETDDHLSVVGGDTP